MADVVMFKGEALDDFLEGMAELRWKARTVEFWIDPLDGGLKVKVDGWGWSPAKGELQTRCGCEGITSDELGM